MDSENKRLIASDIAKRYYINGETQEDIARTNNMSRSNVSRILKKCVEDGIVEITVNDVISENPSCARRIQLGLGLKEVIIVPNSSSSDRLNRYIGERLSMYLMSILKSNMLLGVARGRALYYTAKSLNNSKNIRVDVVQLQGAVSPTITSDESNALISLFAYKLNGKGYVMNAPLMVKSKRTKEDLLNNDILKPIIQKYHQLDVAIFEIESPRLHVSNISSDEWLSRADMLQLNEVGVVASICGHYFDAQGISCNVGINDRVLAINSELLKYVHYSIGISVDKHSLIPTLSIIKSGMINVLVISEELALQLDSYLQKNN